MGENNVASGSIGPIILIAIVAYFVYGHSIDAMVGVVAIALVVGMVQIFSIIPVIGWIGGMMLNYWYVIPKMLILTGLETSWLIFAIFVLYTILGFVITCGMVLFVVGMAKS